MMKKIPNSKLGSWVGTQHFASLLVTLFISFCSFAQPVTETFTASRIINGHSVETLKKRHLEYRIEHRFGDFAGTNGGGKTGFGFDNASDIRFAFEYGVSDKLMIGFGRNKGANEPWKGLLDGFVKYRLLHQEKGKMPISMAIIGTMTGTYSKSNPDISALNHYEKIEHRLAYSTQINVAKKFGSRLSLALMPTYIHRNLVRPGDLNDLFALGGAFNVRITKKFGFTTEYYYCLRKKPTSTPLPSSPPPFTNSLAFGLEWNTNGHTFHFSVSNARGFNDTQFIPYTTADWLKGEFRIGFSIARAFKI